MIEPDPTADYDDDRPQGACPKCGAGDCEWVHTGVRWRLVEDGGHFHVCKPNADGFEDLSKNE